MGEQEQEAGIPEWVVTFGDMMSLLLTFFVLLFSMSEVKQEQSTALIESLRRQFGSDRSTMSMMPGLAPPTNATLNKLPSLGRARRADTMKGGDKVSAPVGDFPRVLAIRPSRDAALGGVVYFPEGESQLTEEDRRILEAAVRTIGGKPQKIEVRGHTSSRPLPRKSTYRNHWDLGYARGVNVMEYLVRLGIDPKRIRVTSAADHEPIHTGYDELLRRRNSRVEILMTDELVADLRGGVDEPSGDVLPGGPAPTDATDLSPKSK